MCAMSFRLLYCYKINSKNIPAWKILISVITMELEIILLKKYKDLFWKIINGRIRNCQMSHSV